MYEDASILIFITKKNADSPQLQKTITGILVNKGYDNK